MPSRKSSKTSDQSKRIGATVFFSVVFVVSAWFTYKRWDTPEAWPLAAITLASAAMIAFTQWLWSMERRERDRNSKGG